METEDRVLKLVMLAIGIILVVTIAMTRGSNFCIVALALFVAACGYADGRARGK